MFGSNQILQVSGALDQIEEALNFALSISRSTKSKLTYQISDKGCYCIGWTLDKDSDSWKKFPEFYDVHVIATIIKNYLKNVSYPEDSNRFFDGSSVKGFLMSNIEDTLMTDEYIKDAFYGIVKFEPYWLYYGK